MNTASHNRSADLGLFLLRAVLAVVFVYHGSQKLFGWFGGYGIEGTAGWMASIGIPLPTLSTILAGSAEFFGGIALLLGVGTRVASLAVAFTMLVAIATVHHSAFDARAGGMEYQLTLGTALVALALIGPGRIAVERLLAAGARSLAVHSGRPATA